MAARVCKDCKRQDIIIDYQSGDVVCTSCGVVQEQRLIDETQEWRNFGKDATTAGDGNMSNRIGAVYDENFEDGGMGLSVGGQGADSKLFMKLTNRSGTDKQLKNVFSHIETIITSLEIGKEIFEVSKQIMKKVDESKKCKGKNEKAVACAVVFIACREKQESRTIKEIVEVLKAKKKDVSKSYSIIKKLENIGLSASNESAGEYAVRICTRLGIDKLSGYAKKIAEFANQKDLAGKTPQTIASATVYFICQSMPEFKERITLSQIHEVFNMGESTIKSAFKELLNIKNKLPGYDGE